MYLIFFTNNVTINAQVKWCALAYRLHQEAIGVVSWCFFICIL